jgi:hypothetical protein
VISEARRSRYIDSDGQASYDLGLSSVETESVITYGCDARSRPLPNGGVTGHEVATSPDGRRAFVPIHGNSGVGLPATDGSTLDVIDLSGGVLIPNVAVLLQSFVDDAFEFRTDRPPFSFASQVSSHRLSGHDRAVRERGRCNWWGGDAGSKSGGTGRP